MTDFVVKDAQHLEGFVPQIFETYFEKVYAPSEKLSMKLKGIVDRIDIDLKNIDFDVVIIDEASMLTEEMFGAMMQALSKAKRIIFVG